MGSFGSEQEVYAELGDAFAALVADPQLQRANTVVQYRCRAPEATITLDLRQGGEARVELGSETEVEPEVVLDLDADTLCGLLNGEINMPVALARGDVCAHGPVAKLLKVVMVARRVGAGRAAAAPAPVRA